MNANATTTLTWNAPPWVVWFAAAALVATLAFCFLTWQRNGRKWSAGVLELLRLAIVCGALVTLCQPEFRETYTPAEQPVLCVLWDDSQSMDTRDVVDPDSPSQPPQLRQEWVARIREADFWKSLGDNVRLVAEPFSTQDRVAGTDINGALESALTKHAYLRAVVLLTDGDWNAGQSPLTAATKLRMANVPVFTVPVGSEVPLPDIEIAALDPPTFSVIGKSLQIPFTLKSTLPRDYEATVSLKVGDGEVLEKVVTIPSMGEVQEVLFWTPQDVGKIVLTMTVPPEPGETILANNTKDVEVTIRSESLRVLVVESYPRWEYRYLRNALERDPGVEVACLLFHPHLDKVGGGPGYIKAFPESQDELAKFDVVFLGDVGVKPGQLTGDQANMLKGLVEQQASGLVFIPGLQGEHFRLLDTELADLYPVVLDADQPNGFGSAVPTQFLLTEQGRGNLLTKLADTEQENMAIWRGLPGCQWRSPAVRAKAGTQVLAIDERSRAPLLVTRTFGTGKILFIGTDGAWRWREGVEDKYHYRFWGQVARWMAYQRHMADGEMLRMFYSPDRPLPGSVVTLNATMLDPAGAPLVGGTLTAEITDPSGSTQRVNFQQARGEWGLYSARFQPTQPGKYRVVLDCKETSARLEAEVSVQGEAREQVGKPAKPGVLEEIAEVTRGEVVPLDQVDLLANKVLELPEPDPLVKRIPLWAHPAWAGTLIGMLGIFWVGRKLRGTI